MQIPTTFQAAMNRRYPEPVAIALALDAHGVPNPITLHWVMPTALEPPLLAISIERSRYSLAAVQQAREFVVSFPSTGMNKEVIYFGTKSGREVAKLEACGTRTQPASVIRGVLLADAVANFECVLESELETGDHVLFVGRVVAAHMHAEPAIRRVYAFGNSGLAAALSATPL